MNATVGVATRVLLMLSLLSLAPTCSQYTQHDRRGMTSSNPTFRQPSAFLQIALSLAALIVVLGQIVLVGVARQADEGTAAHLWQLLILAQAPIVAFFAIKYLPQRPRQALLILGLLFAAVLAACAPVFLLRL